MRRTDVGGAAAVPRLGDSTPSPAVPRPRDIAVRPPAQRREAVRRVALLARLDRAPAGSLTLLVAPGGYGKTTVLSQWAARAGPLAWVSADRDDNDPGRLARHIALALDVALPLDPQAPGLSARVDASSRLAFADLLSAVAALRRRGRPVVLVLDDLHEISSRASLALVRSVLDEGGPALRMAAAGRTRPDLGLPELAAAGRCLELGAADLAFSEVETRQVFAFARQVLTPDVARTVVQQTEGWPAGVYLAALAGRQGWRSASSAVRPGVIAGDDVYIADHFRSEVLAGEPSDNVRFLLRTAALERMTGPLCDAVLRTTGSGARLREAARRNLFVVPVGRDDREARWFRYHRLFRETLLAELRLREPGEEVRLHRRAAAWFESEGLTDEAITHALAGGDKLRAARLVDLIARRAFADGRRTVVQHWLRELDDEALAAYPPLAVTAGWIWGFGAYPDRAQSCLRVARAARFDGPLPDGSRSLDAATAQLAAFLVPSGVRRMLDDAQRALDLEPADSPGRAVPLMVLGVAHVLNGRNDLGTPALTEAAEIARAHRPDAAALARAELAVLALAGGDTGAEAQISASLALLDEAGLGHDVVAVLTHAAAAWSAALRGDEVVVRRHVGVAQRIEADTSLAGFPWYAAQVGIVLGRVALEVGDPLAARARIEEVRQHLGHLLTEGVLRAQVDELADLLAGTSAPAAQAGPMALTAAEVRVLQLLPTHLSLSEIAEELHISRNTVKTQVAAIYRKLQAATRAEAVRRGRELSLLA